MTRLVIQTISSSHKNIKITNIMHLHCSKVSWELFYLDIFFVSIFLAHTLQYLLLLPTYSKVFLIGMEMLKWQRVISTIVRFLKDSVPQDSRVMLKIV